MLTNLIKKFIDFYLYSSIHIALGASLSVILCYSVLYHLPNSDYPFFVFFSTLFLYCSHRIVGIQKVKAFENEGRFAIIKKFKVHLILYAILGAVASIYFFFGLERRLQLILLIPGLISILYILPIFSNNKRLRDFDNIKIFLIAISWGFIIGAIPYIEVKQTFDVYGLMYFLEKTLFIFAITIPFDIRDLKVDENNNVSTIPSRVGSQRAYRISFILLCVCLLAVALLYFYNIYSIKVMLSLSAGYLLTMVMIFLSKEKKHDYYYSGMLDGSIILTALFGIISSGILSVLF